jgi:uncharacterized protein (UPF0335 family)
MDQTSSMGNHEEIYEKIDNLFQEPPTYQDLVKVVSQECKQRGYTQEAIEETIIDYFFYGAHYSQYRE